jgi:hypothetical protein
MSEPWPRPAESAYLRQLGSRGIKWWVIRTRYERRDRRVLYWGDEGWGDLHSATLFRTADTIVRRLPLAGTWQEVEVSGTANERGERHDARRAIRLVPDVAGCL